MNNTYDSNLFNNELFDILLVQKIQYNEYNLNEEEIIKKLIKFLILQKNFSIEESKIIIKNFYSFNPFDITSYEIDLIIDFINFDYLLDSTLTNSNDYIPIRQNIPRHSINLNDIIDQGTTQTDIESYINDNIENDDNIENEDNDVNESIESFNVNESIESFNVEEPNESMENIINDFSLEDNSINNLTDYLFPLNNIYNTDESYINSFFESYPIVYNNMRSIINYNSINNFTPRLDLNTNTRVDTLFNNIINNPLINNDVIENQSASLLYSYNPNRIIRRNFTTRILETINNILSDQQIEEEMEDIPIVLTEEAYEVLEKKKYIELDENIRNEYKQCSISMEEFKDDTLIIRLPCNHYFSDDFAKKWLLENSHKCPLCRKSAGENKPII